MSVGRRSGPGRRLAGDGLGGHHDGGVKDGKRLMLRAADLEQGLAAGMVERGGGGEEAVLLTK